MSQPMSGSTKLKERCQTMASLTPEEITQVAGGFSFGGFNLSSWWIRGIPLRTFINLDFNNRK